MKIPNIPHLQIYAFYLFCVYSSIVYSYFSIFQIVSAALSLTLILKFLSKLSFLIMATVYNEQSSDTKLPPIQTNHSIPSNVSNFSINSNESTDTLQLIDEDSNSVSAHSLSPATANTSSTNTPIHRRGAFSSSPTPPKISSSSEIAAQYKRKHKSSNLSPVVASQYIHNKNSSFPNLALSASAHRFKSRKGSWNNHDENMATNSKKRKRKKSSKKWKRTISSDNLLNTVKRVSSARSKALIKLKHKEDSEIFNDSEKVRKCKKFLNHEINTEMTEILETAQNLYDAHTKHLEVMNKFSTTIHSSIDLGRNRGSKNTHYFGQYMKMMASTMHSIENIYLEHKINGLKEYFIDPFEAFLEDDDIQKCINTKFEYSKIKNKFNNNSTKLVKDKLELEEAENSFVNATFELIKKREDKILYKLMNYQQCLLDYTIKQQQYINSKRVINGYDEMKENKYKIKNQIQNEILTITTDQEFYKYFADNVQDDNPTNNMKKAPSIHVDSKENDSEDKSEIVRAQKLTKYTMILFHRNKFPPSTNFMMEAFGPAANRYNIESNNDVTMKFVIVKYNGNNCKEVIDKYNIDAFPTVLVFIKHKVSNNYKPVIGNSQETRDELQFIVKKMAEKVNPNNSRRGAVNLDMMKSEDNDMEDEKEEIEAQIPSNETVDNDMNDE